MEDKVIVGRRSAVLWGRLAVLVTVISLLLAACASPSGPGKAAGPATSETEATAPATRTVEHALGTATIPTEPRRIVVLNQYLPLDALVALGIKPVGSSGDPAAAYPFAMWLQGRTEGIELVGSTEEPNLEQIARLAPDLILSNPWQEDIHGQLSQIAPTVALPLEYRDYEQELREIADLVGRGPQAQQLIASHHERLGSFRARFADILDKIEVSVIRVFPDNIRVEGEGYVDTLFDRAGIRRPPAQRNLTERLELSLEQLPQVDGDVIIVYSAANAAAEQDNAAARHALMNHPLWRQLRAVQQDQVYVVDSFLWAGGGILWANAVLDDLTTRILPRVAERHRPGAGN